MHATACVVGSYESRRSGYSCMWHRI